MLMASPFQANLCCGCMRGLLRNGRKSAKQGAFIALGMGAMSLLKATTFEDEQYSFNWDFSFDKDRLMQVLSQAH